MKKILFALAVLCSFSCFAAPGGLTSPIISGGGGSGGGANTNALTPTQNNLLTNSAQLPLSQYGVLTSLPSNAITNHYLPTLLAAQAQFTNILWPDGVIFVHQFISSGQDEILYQNQNTFWDQHFLYNSDGSFLVDLLLDKLFGNGLGVTNTPSSTLSSSNASVTIARSVNPITGETNYDLAASGGGGSPIASNLVSGPIPVNINTDITTNPPSGPNASIIAGDSLSSGFLGVTNFYMYLTASDQYGFVFTNTINTAVAGQTASNILLNYNSEIGQYANNSPTNTYLFLWAGINDINTAGYSAPQVFGFLTNIWLNAHSNGMLVVAFTVTTLSTVTHQGAEQTAQLNYLIRNASSQWDYLVDAASVLPNPQHTDWYQDGIEHFNSMAHSNLAINVNQVLRRGKHQQNTKLMTDYYDGTLIYYDGVLQNTFSINSAPFAAPGTPVITGTDNSSFGYLSLANLTAGFGNSTFGWKAGNATGSGGGANQNTAFGYQALLQNISGAQNTAIGANALDISTGSQNVGIGIGAGQNVTTGANNIEIANSGLAGDNGIIRIGDIQTDAYIVGTNHVSSIIATNWVAFTTNISVINISQISTTTTITNGIGQGIWCLSLSLVDNLTGNPVFVIRRPGVYTNTIAPLAALLSAGTSTTTNYYSFRVEPNTTNSITDVSGTGASVSVIDSHIEQ